MTPGAARAPPSSSALRTTRPSTFSTIWNGAPSTESSLRMVTARATGTGVSASAGDHLVLAGHIVRRRGEPVQRRAAQHPLRRVVEHPEGQVGAAAGDQFGPQLTGAGDAFRAQVRVQGVEVESVESCHADCLPLQ